jgi:HPt (histidine-containing phosphotransfer) domain-containing protein
MIEGDVSESEPPLDLAKALAVVGGDRSLLLELAQVFQDELPDRVAALRDAVRTADAGGTRHAAHNLKGALASLGATRGRDFAAELEQLALSGDLGPASTTLAALEGELSRITDFMSRPGWLDSGNPF